MSSSWVVWEVFEYWGLKNISVNISTDNISDSTKIPVVETKVPDALDKVFPGS